MAVDEYVPRRGDVVWTNFSPQAGREQAGRRPAIVLSAQSYNRRSGLAVVCPITSQAKGHPFELALDEGLSVSGVVLCDHIRSVDWRAQGMEFACSVSRQNLADVLALIHLLL